MATQSIATDNVLTFALMETKLLRFTYIAWRYQYPAYVQKSFSCGYCVAKSSGIRKV